MSYSKLEKQWHKDFLKRQEQEQQQEQKIRDIDEKIKVNQILSPMFEERKQRTEQQEIIRQKNEIKNILVGTLPYKQWLILWDFLNEDISQIKTDLAKGKIQEQDIFYVMDKANNIHNIFSYQ